MSDFKEKCIDYFGTSDFYDILSLKKDASEKEVKKAYHRLSLLVHPDRVSGDEKLVATEKFKVLGRIHSILQNEEKRKHYDTYGECDEDDLSSNWMEYWRNLFKKIEIKDIDDYKKEYIGSETERLDIKKAYVNAKGDMNKIMTFVPFCDCENEPRIIEIVREMVDANEVEEYDGFFNEKPSKRRRRHRKYEKERKEIEENPIPDDLASAIHERRPLMFAEMLKNLEDKYGNKKKKAISNVETTEKKLRRGRSKK